MDTETPTIQTLPYSITSIDPRQVKVKPNKYKWNLAQPDFDSVVNNPITYSTEEIVFAAVAVLTRTDAGFEGHTYYLEEEHTPHGWDSTDCEVVVQSPMPEPHALPFGALPVPVNVTDLVLDVSVKAYGSKSEAASDTNALTTLSEGSYLVFATADNGMLRVGQSRDGIKYWINPADNQLPVPEEPEPTPMNWVSPREDSDKPEPEPIVETVPEPVPDFTWKDSYVPYEEPRHYVCNVAYPATNVDPDGRPVSIMVRAGDDVTVYGYFYREGVKFHRLHAKSDVEYVLWVALPAVHKERAVLVLPGPSWLDWLFHRYQQTKTVIFPIKVNGEDRYIDSVKNPYKGDKKR